LIALAIKSSTGFGLGAKGLLRGFDVGAVAIGAGVAVGLGAGAVLVGKIKIGLGLAAAIV
jgi:hypothetical protein